MVSRSVSGCLRSPSYSLHFKSMLPMGGMLLYSLRSCNLLVYMRSVLLDELDVPDTLRLKHVSVSVHRKSVYASYFVLVLLLVLAHVGLTSTSSHYKFKSVLLAVVFCFLCPKLLFPLFILPLPLLILGVINLFLLFMLLALASVCANILLDGDTMGCGAMPVSTEMGDRWLWWVEWLWACENGLLFLNILTKLREFSIDS